MTVTCSLLEQEAKGYSLVYHDSPPPSANKHTVPCSDYRMAFTARSCSYLHYQRLPSSPDSMGIWNKLESLFSNKSPSSSITSIIANGFEGDHMLSPSHPVSKNKLRAWKNIFGAKSKPPNLNPNLVYRKICLAILYAHTIHSRFGDEIVEQQVRELRGTLFDRDGWPSEVADQQLQTHEEDIRKAYNATELRREVLLLVGEAAGLAALTESMNHFVLQECFKELLIEYGMYMLLSRRWN